MSKKIENDKKTKDFNEADTVDMELEPWESGSKMGRPLLDIDKNKLIALAELQCTLEEMASFYGCSDKTIVRRIERDFGVTFGVFYKIYSPAGRISIRRKQIRMAEEGNVPLLIHLGKTLLNQSEKKQLELSGNLNASIVDAIEGEE